MTERMNTPNVEFQQDERFHAGSSSVAWTAVNGKKEIACRVSQELLAGYYGAGRQPEELIATFRSHRDVFEQIALEKIRCGDVESDRSGLFARVVSADYFRQSSV
ncbi:MAG: DUF1488 family protein [Myxococcales bacterium]|nr:DUF1488 family protein [Myxococcales bacterium]